MIPKRHPATTRWLGAPQGWEPEAHGTCGHLAIADVAHPAGQAMLSLWEPTPDELAALNAGAAVELRIVGINHPVVSIGVAQSVEPVAEGVAA